MATSRNDPEKTGDRRFRGHRRSAELREDLAPILAEWEALSADEPWHVAPERYGVDALHETVRAVLDVSLGDGGDREASERLVRAAASHGDQRRIQGSGDDAVLREYHALRAALWRHLRTLSMPANEALTTISRVDVVITIATTAALRGYHRSDTLPPPDWASELLRSVTSGSRGIETAFGRPGRENTGRRRAKGGERAGPRTAGDRDTKE